MVIVLRHSVIIAALIVGLMAPAPTAAAPAIYCGASNARVSAQPAGGAREVYRYSFGGSVNDAESPAGPLIRDASGSLYGLGNSGGSNFAGAAYKMTATPYGFHESVIFSFGGSAGADYYPVGGLVADGAGNLYGVNSAGGTQSEGTVFELSPTPAGYVETVIYNFAPYTVDFIDYPPSPNGSLISDASGALYGTTAGGGYGPGPGFGTVFKLTPTPNGYVQSSLYAFGSNPNDGLVPSSGVVIDEHGAIYGTALDGGVHGRGTVYKLTPSTSGYRERTLHAFGEFKGDGAFPFAGLILGPGGSLYGTTLTGGINDHGTVFALAPVGAGQYHETVLFRFEGNEGEAPYGGLVADPLGNLLGSTEVYGAHGAGGGLIFELSPTPQGCAETVLHRFTGGGGDGLNPISSLILDPAGNIYGTTPAGGTYQNGMLFEMRRN
jgi:uncharacterized repeat protein (TIGR03803 family)